MSIRGYSSGGPFLLFILLSLFISVCRPTAITSKDAAGLGAGTGAGAGAGVGTGAGAGGPGPGPGGVSTTSLGSSIPSRCDEITIPMCKGIGYNYTHMPNQFNHDSQEEAGMEVHQYWPLVEIKCSPDLRFFLCSLYVPICLEDFAGTVPPCRSVCERARYGCEPVMVHYGFQWPARMKCDSFPKYGKGDLCMDEKKGEAPPSTPLEIPKGSSASGKMAGKRPKLSGSGGGGGVGGNGGGPGGGSELLDNNENGKCECECRAPLVKLDEKNLYFNRTDHLIETGTVRNCALPCHGGYGSEDEINFSTWWLSLWSGLCCFTTFVTLLTFLIDPKRFKYPERPIVYLSACYLMVSVGYLIRLWRGHEEIACKGTIVRYGIETGATSAWCTVVFLLIYYFGMASSVWWVVLSLTWYLAAGLKWGSEAISSHAHLFHIAAWVLPALGTFVALTDGAVDGDAISGICSIGNQDPLRLSIYIVAPLGILLVLGTTFLLAGFIALVRIRTVIARQAGRAKTEKLEKLMIRIGVFSVLYTLPASAVIAAFLYEMSVKHQWLSGITCSCKVPVQKPLYSILMLKYFMSLAVGITSGVWIWSGKTVESWQNFFQRFCGKSSASTTKYTSAIYHHPSGKNLSHV